MRWVKLTALLSLWAFFFGLVAMVHVWISILALPNRWKIISRLNRNFMLLFRLILNIKVIAAGEEGQLERGGYVVVANHVGYVDGIVLGSLFPILLVSKKEVKRWPVVGQWNTLCGTIFINRQQKEKVPLLVHEMRRKLKQKANILLFPEGRSTDGETMLPFQTVPLAAPLRNRSIIVPVTIAYKNIEQEPVSAANRDLIYWYGDADTDFLSHFWKFLALRSVEVVVTIQPQVECCRYEDTSAGRKKLAEDCFDRVLGLITEKDSLPEEEQTIDKRRSSTLLSS